MARGGEAQVRADQGSEAQVMEILIVVIIVIVFMSNRTK